MTYDDPQLEEMVRHSARFVRAMQQGDRPSWLVILGSSGAGKTHCAKHIWNKMKASFDHSQCDYVPHLIFWPKFIEELREGVREGAGIKRFLDVIRWPLVVLDDIGAGQDKTGFASDKLNTLLSGRVGKWTIITSNLSLEGVAQIDPRIASRMVREPGNLIIDLNVTDYGLRKEK